MFANFIEVQFLGGPDKQELIYFSKLMKQERTRANPTVLVPFNPAKIVRSYPPNSQGVVSSSKFKCRIVETYQYKSFPRLNTREFVPTRLTDMFIEDTTTVNPKKEDEARVGTMSNSELTRYMLECIFEVWFKVFTHSIQYYPLLYSIDFIRYAYNFLLLVKKKVILNISLV